MLVNVPNPANDIRAFQAETSRAIAALASVKLGANASPTFNRLTLNSLTATRLVSTNSSKGLASTNLASWVTGTANRVTVADDGDGTITLNGPQDLHTTGSPTFDDLTLSTPSNIYALSHDSFADFVADEHVAHSGVTLTAGDGLTGGGDISVSRTFDLDTSYSATFAGLTITNACVLGANSVILQPGTDAATFFQVLDADGGNPVLNVDTDNERIGIGTAAPSGVFEVVTAQTRILIADATGSPNIKMGYLDNVNTGLGANAILGGGANGAVNQIDGAATSYATIVGGYDNVLDGANSTAALDVAASTIGGGAHNKIVTTHGTIAGGSNNIINDNSAYSTISGGTGNTVSANSTYCTITGGANNIAGESYATVGGGSGCEAESTGSLVSGGFGNKVDGTDADYGTVVGGYQNVISGSSTRSTICGGHQHTITGGAYSTICGGYDCDITADYSTILGGRGCIVSAAYALAVGRRAIASGQGAFSLADSTDADFTVSTANQFGARFSGGYLFSGGHVEIDTPTDLASEALQIDQNDDDQAFIDFAGTSAADSSKNISTQNGDGVVEGPKNYSSSNGWQFEGMVKIEVNGVARWMPYYSEDTS